MAQIARGPKLYKEMSDVIQKRDFRFIPRDADPGFDPEHNKRVIEETIKENDLREKQLEKEYLNKVEERVDAGISFLKKLSTGAYESLTPHEAALKYFGKRELTRLRGEQIRRDLMARMGIKSGIIK